MMTAKFESERMGDALGALAGRLEGLRGDAGGMLAHLAGTGRAAGAARGDTYGIEVEYLLAEPNGPMRTFQLRFDRVAEPGEEGSYAYDEVDGTGIVHDETEFDVEGLDFEDLRNLFDDFVEENGYTVVGSPHAVEVPYDGFLYGLDDEMEGGERGEPSL